MVEEKRWENLSTNLINDGLQSYINNRQSGLLVRTFLRDKEETFIMIKGP